MRKIYLKLLLSLFIGLICFTCFCDSAGCKGGVYTINVNTTVNPVGGGFSKAWDATACLLALPSSNTVFPQHNTKQIALTPLPGKAVGYVMENAAADTTEAASTSKTSVPIDTAVLNSSIASDNSVGKRDNKTDIQCDVSSLRFILNYGLKDINKENNITNMPVLDQGNSMGCPYFSTITALNILFGEKNNYSILKTMWLSTYLSPALKTNENLRILAVDPNEPANGKNYFDELTFTTKTDSKTKNILNSLKKNLISNLRKDYKIKKNDSMVTALDFSDEMQKIMNNNYPDTFVFYPWPGSYPYIVISQIKNFGIPEINIKYESTKIDDYSNLMIANEKDLLEGTYTSPFPGSIITPASKNFLNMCKVAANQTFPPSPEIEVNLINTFFHRTHRNNKGKYYNRKNNKRIVREIKKAVDSGNSIVVIGSLFFPVNASNNSSDEEIGLDSYFNPNTFTLSTSMPDGETANTWGHPHFKHNPAGGHCMVVIGYIDFEKNKNPHLAHKYGRGLLILKNSFGKGKSLNQENSIWDGTYFMSYKYANICTVESFSIKNTENAKVI
jgi:hypothetical protein